MVEFRTASFKSRLIINLILSLFSAMRPRWQQADWLRRASAQELGDCECPFAIVEVPALKNLTSVIRILDFAFGAHPLAFQARSPIHLPPLQLFPFSK